MSVGQKRVYWPEKVCVLQVALCGFRGLFFPPFPPAVIVFASNKTLAVILYQQMTRFL